MTPALPPPTGTTADASRSSAPAVDDWDWDEGEDEQYTVSNNRNENPTVVVAAAASPTVFGTVRTGAAPVLAGGNSSSTITTARPPPRPPSTPAASSTAPTSRVLLISSGSNTGHQPEYDEHKQRSETDHDNNANANDEADFEARMRERNRLRKEREEHHMATLKVQLGRLEDALAAETTRRVDATTGLDDTARRQIYEMEQRLRQQLQDDHAQLYDRLDQLEHRVQFLQEKWQTESGDQLKSIEAKAEGLAKALGGIRQGQAVERKARLRREGQLLEQVESVAKEFEERWNHERQDRINRIGELEQQITGHEARLMQKQQEYEDRIDEELAALQQELALEVQERQAGDDEIVAALNRHTEQMKRHLAIL